MTHIPPFAPFVVLAFLGTLALAALGILTALVALAWRRRPLAWAALGAGAGVVVLYLVVVLGFSLASRERVLAPGEEKYFCEIDCHLAYAVTGARVVPSPAPGREPDRLVVTVRTRFDETTIAPWRGNAPLSPNARVALLADGSGHEEAPLAATRAVVAGSGLAPLTQPLRPGESYLTELTFVLPPSPERCRLFLGSGDGETLVLIGHENSILHRKVWFALPPIARAAAASQPQNETAPATPTAPGPATGTTSQAVGRSAAEAPR